MSNGLPIQSAKVAPIPTTDVVETGLLGSISDFASVIGKTVNSLVPVADKLVGYQLARQEIKQRNALSLDGTWFDGNQLFDGGLGNGNNQTLLVIAGLAAAAVAVILIVR